jgi:hypothetical protein
MARISTRKKQSTEAVTARKIDSDAAEIPQADHPAGYHVGGTKLATLREVLEPSTPTMSLTELTQQQRIDLVIARLQAKPDDFRIAMIGPGIINKARAIAEVQAGTRVGRTLMEIEQLMISTLTESANRRG